MMEVCDWKCTKEAMRTLQAALGCGVCDKPLQEPCTLGSCDHLFCRTCVDVHLGKSCPVCHAPAWVKDLQVKRELASVVTLYNKLLSIIDEDATTTPDESKSCSAENDNVIVEMTHSAGRRVEIEIVEPMVDTTAALITAGTRRNALRTRNASPQRRVAQSAVQKKKLHGSIKPISSPRQGQNEMGKDSDKESETSTRRLLVQGSSASKVTAGSSSGSENDLMSVFDFVPSPQGPKPMAKKRVRKPNAKTVKRQRVAAANRRWLRGNALGKPGEESESGFDSERSLKHVSFSVDSALSEASSGQVSSSLESMEVSSQGELPASAGEDLELNAEAMSGCTQESGYNTASTLDVSILNGQKQLPPCNNQVGTVPNDNKTLNPKPENRQDDKQKPTKRSSTKSGNASPALQDLLGAEHCTLRQAAASRSNQASSANGKAIRQDKKLPPSKTSLTHEKKEPKKRQQVALQGQSREGSSSSATNSSLQEKDVSSPPKRRRGRSQEIPESINSSSTHEKNSSKSLSDSRTEELSADILPTQQSKPKQRQVPKREARTTSTPPSTTQTSQKREPGTPSCPDASPSSRKLAPSPRNSCAVAKRNKRGETPLHVAVIKGDIDAARQLLQEGADPNAKDNAGWMPLHEACNHGHAAIAAVLLDHGALINAPGFEHDSPLHDAVMNHRLDVVKLLLQRGASLGVRNVHGLTPADYAKSDAMKTALKTQALAATATTVPAADSQKSSVARNQPVVLLGTGLKDAQKKQLKSCAKLLGGGRVVDEFGPEVTHLVASCNRDNQCMRTMKYLNAILRGMWVVSFEWVTECLRTKKRAPEVDFEVNGTTALPTSSGPEKGRMNAYQQLPGLLDGCHFYLYSTFSAPTPAKPAIVQLVKNGGGKILSRQPKPDDDIVQASTTVPYHMPPGSELAACSHFIIHDHNEGRAPPRVRTGKLCTAPVSWLMDCISQFEILDLP